MYSYSSVIFSVLTGPPNVQKTGYPLKSLLLKICPFQDKKHHSFSGTLRLNKVNTFEKLTHENLSFSGQETWISFCKQARAVSCEPSTFWFTSVMSFSLQGSLVIETCTPKKKETLYLILHNYLFNVLHPIHKSKLRLAKGCFSDISRKLHFCFFTLRTTQIIVVYA